MCIANETHSKARRKPQRNNFKTFGELRKTEDRTEKHFLSPNSKCTHAVTATSQCSKTDQAARLLQILKPGRIQNSKIQSKRFLQMVSVVKNKTNFILPFITCHFHAVKKHKIVWPSRKEHGSLSSGKNAIHVQCEGIKTQAALPITYTH